MTKQPLRAGLDEVGMGCLAGPLVVAVAAFPSGSTRIAGVTDSKKLSWRMLVSLASVISEKASWIGYGFASVETINKHGIKNAWNSACLMALQDAPELKHLVIDGLYTVQGYDGAQHAEPKADLTQWECSAASIIAKVMRDSEMIELHEHYRPYCWDRNVGYSSEVHRKALLEYGATPLHRKKYIRSVFDPKPKKEKKPSRF